MYKILTRVSVSHLRQHLPAYLKRVQEGEAIQITSRGRVIARLEAEHDPALAAREWLEKLKGRVTLVDVVSPIEPDLADGAWSATALQLGAPLITADARLRALTELDTVW